MTILSVDQVSDKAFDYVVVGGGTSGLVVASRLTEDPNFSVLVLEAGSANIDDPEILTPARFGSHFRNPQYDWAYTTVPQDGLEGRSVYWARGKGLGGSSAINFFQYHLPAKGDIDAFEELGNKGWNWNLFKKHYDKAEHFVVPQKVTDSMSFDPKEHGSDGPLTVAYPITSSNLEKVHQDALSKLGINRVREPFSGNTNGSWMTPVTIDPTKLVRSYATNMYYHPNASRSNLGVLTDAHVSCVATSRDGAFLTASTVSFIHGGKTYKVLVGKEVVLAAGAIATPQILELSGIGDKEVLKRAGIEVKHHLPGVGANVQEHIYSGATYEIRKECEDDYLTFDCLSDPDEKKKQEELYKQGKGVFGMSVVPMAFVPFSAVSPDADAMYRKLSEDISAGIKADKYSASLQKQLRIQLEHIKRKEPTCELVLSNRFGTFPNPAQPKRKYITTTCLVNHPMSRGTIHVVSNDPLKPPAIDPHYCEESFDILSFVEMIKFSRRLVQQEPLKSILTGEEINPGRECQTDEQIAAYLKKYFNTTYHTVGSCSMLPIEDDGVVDTKLKVYGTTNIRIADISTIPLHIGAHLQSTAYALGELAADIIKGKVFA